MLYDLAYMWNLFEKNNTSEKEVRLVVARSIVVGGWNWLMVV